MQRIFATLFFSLGILFSYSQTKLAEGKQPQMTVDSKGIIRLVFGQNDNIYFSSSTNNGVTFSMPVLIAEVKGMHLGMTRGPQLATSKEMSLVTAMDKDGNIHSFIMNHKSGTWAKSGKVNDANGSAPEGLMSTTADDNNHFYAVWLDLRNDRKNNICISMFDNKKWSPNKFAYVSPESHVCECCKPSIVVKGQNVSIMFRNWLKGSRDLYLTVSTDGGRTFSQAQKLGNGTWLLKGCPMDGGGISIDANNITHTAWQRDGIVYYTQPGQPEQKIGEGRHVAVNANLIAWETGSDLIVKRIDGQPKKIGEGTALETSELKDKTILAVWEKDGQIVFKKL